MMEHDYRDVLLKAASYVEQGWCQEEWYRSERGIPCKHGCEDGHIVHEVDPSDVLEGVRPDKVCLEGAINLAAFDLFDDVEALDFGSMHPAVLDASDRMSDLIGTPSHRLYMWNDADGRTADEVADALRRAAE